MDDDDVCEMAAQPRVAAGELVGRPSASLWRSQLNAWYVGRTRWSAGSSDCRGRTHLKILPGKFIENVNWWAGHLHEAVARGIEEQDLQPSGLLHPVFGSTTQGINDVFAWAQGEELGYWPQVYLGLPGGHVLSVVYFGKPRYDIEYRYGSPEGFTVLLACDGPNFMLGGLRWPEVRAVACNSPGLASRATLLLAPATSVSEGEEEDAYAHLSEALATFGGDASQIDCLTHTLIQGMRSSSGSWRFDARLGWISTDVYNWRCPQRPDRQLTPIGSECFAALRAFTESLGLNPPAG
jgi:hypothetical protein